MSWFSNVADVVKLLFKLNQLEGQLIKQAEKIQELETENRNKSIRLDTLTTDITGLREKLDVQKDDALKLSLKVEQLSVELAKMQNDFKDELKISSRTYDLLERKLESLNGKIEDGQKRQEMERQAILKDIKILILEEQLKQKESPRLLLATTTVTEEE